MAKTHAFTKNEKLKGKKAIDLLFKEGKGFNQSFFRVLYVVKNEKESPKICISIPKKNIKSAVNRNLLKRRIREVYRLNNTAFKRQLLSQNTNIHFIVIYNSKQIMKYKDIEDKIKVILTRLMDLSEVVGK